MSEQPLPNRAVFLSYASQDAEAAARISEALRAAGVEVWLDTSDLRGGDSWDAQIKKHIQECAIFIPLISARTNARAEGYFRREWNLARRRLLDMADDLAFLVPVVIDETREADARVPEEFLRAQWTWLPGGETPPAFAQRVRQLLGGDSAGPHPTQSGVVPKFEPSVGVGDARNRGAPAVASLIHRVAGRFGRRHWMSIMAVTAGVVAIVAAASWQWWGTADSDTKTMNAASVSIPSNRLTAPAPAKSIAVLPFINMSGEAGNEYFSDGLSEELINLLAKIPDLRVVARTSAFKFKGEKVDVQEVAQKLNVAHVLEGSVRKSGNRVRITAQLIKAEDGYHLWSETYDRVLDDIFVVQDDIAGAVVKALQVTLLGTEVASRYRTKNPQAYNLLLQGQFFLRRGGREDLQRAIDYFRQSRELDPRYAQAWAGLAGAYGRQVDSGFVPAAEGYERAREAAAKALALEPRVVNAHLAMGYIQSHYDGDWVAADASFRRALELAPNNINVLAAFGLQSMIFGRWDQALDAFSKATTRDPLVANHYTNLGVILEAVGRYQEAESAFRKSLELEPSAPSVHSSLGRSLLLQGKTSAALREMQQEKEELWRLQGLLYVYYAVGRRSEADAMLESYESTYGEEAAYQIAEVHAFRGETDLAFAWLDRAYAQRDGGVTEIKGDPMFRTLRSDRRYKAFLRKLKLPE